MQNGWEIISGVWKLIIWLLIVAVYLFTKYDNPIFGRIIYFSPFWYVLFRLMDKFYLANKKLAEMLLMINVILIGMFIIRGNLNESSYSFNEYWMWYILYWKYIGYFFFLKWKKVILCLYIVMIANIIMMNWFYSGIPFTFYSSTIIILILFPITLIFISQKIAEMIILLKTKKDLIHTIRSILQVFPEGVIIRSVDPTSKRVIIRFANDVAEQFLENINNEPKLSDNFKINSYINKNTLNSWI